MFKNWKLAAVILGELFSTNPTIDDATKTSLETALNADFDGLKADATVAMQTEIDRLKADAVASTDRLTGLQTEKDALVAKVAELEPKAGALAEMAPKYQALLDADTALKQKLGATIPNEASIAAATLETEQAMEAKAEYDRLKAEYAGLIF
jgi:hypothetical protein